MVDSINEFGEIIEDFGGIIINHSYWDCECEHDFIHYTTKTVCEICHSEKEYQPNSRENEIIAYKKRYVEVKNT
jgi:hypothetical protein